MAIWKFTRDSTSPKKFNVSYQVDSLATPIALPPLDLGASTALDANGVGAFPFKSGTFNITAVASESKSKPNVDALGNPMEADTVEFVMNMIATAVTGLVFDAPVMALTWDAIHTQNTEVVSYNVYIDGGAATNVPASTATINAAGDVSHTVSVDATVNHVFSVTAVDSAGAEFGQMEITYTAA